MAIQSASRDNVSCVKAFYVEQDAAIAERIIEDLGRVNIRFYEEGGEGMAPGVYTTLLVFVSETAAADPRLREEVETANANGKGVVVVYLGGTIPEILGDLFDYAEDFVLRPGGEEALLRRLATAHDMRACRKETLEPYEGPLDYVFISYAHKNSADVLPVVRDLQDAGFRIWYDAGIEVGSEWDAYIMDHLKGAKAFVCFQSDEFRASTYCQQEIDCALECMPGAVVIACVNPNETVDKIPEELRKLQGVLRHDYDTDKDFFEKLISAGELESCRDEYRLSDDGKTLEKYLGGSAVVRIPEGVEEIGPRAVATPNARKIILPDGVKKISEQAFVGCGLLEEVVLPETITEIEKEAFLRCGSLREVVIPPEIEVIEESVFADCIALEKITFSGEKVEDILPHAFEDCASLTVIEWPSSIKRLWQHSFAGCSSLDFVIPGSVKAIASPTVFGGCKTVVVDSTNKNYAIREGLLLDAGGTGIYAALDQIATQSEIDIPHGIVNIYDHIVPEDVLDQWSHSHQKQTRQDKLTREELFVKDFRSTSRLGAFSNCVNLTKMILPEGLTTIGSSAFFNCSALETINIPGSVVEIGCGSFMNCISLNDVSLPERLHSIGQSAFKGCQALRSIVIPESVAELGADAFHGCTNLANIVLPKKLTVIERGMLSGCSSLKSVRIPDRVTTIRPQVFQGCTNLVDVVLPSTLIEIGGSAFQDCCSLETLIIPDHVALLGQGVFSGCVSLTNVVLPDKITSLGGFAGCTSLKTINIPSSAIMVEDGAFAHCDSLEYVELPGSITSIGCSAFAGCRSLSSIIVPDSVVEIKHQAFENCGSLTQAVLPEGLNTIEGRLFAGCHSLTSIVMPPSVIKIYAKAFQDCRGLAEITFNEKLKAIGMSAFAGCKSLKHIDIRGKLDSIAADAFEGCDSLDQESRDAIVRIQSEQE